MKSIIKNCLIVIFIFSSILMYNFKVVADGNEDNTNLTYSAVTPDLYSQSNTYSCSEVENDNLLLKYEYDFTAKNGNKVSSDLPQITVLTPGLGGYAYQWGRVAESKALGYFSDSIITKLANVQDSNVYYIDTYSPLIANGEIDFKNANELSGLTYNIYDITAQVYESINNNVEGEPYNLIESIDKISDFTKHSIIIFNGHTVLLENYKAYIEFNYVISSIVKQYKDVKNELPRLNLIGHSRGGLTNLQYTLDHPDLVANLFSIGTPYCGSISAEMDINYHILNQNPSPGEEDIENPVFTENIWEDEKRITMSCIILLMFML